MTSILLPPRMRVPPTPPTPPTPRTPSRPTPQARAVGVVAPSPLLPREVLIPQLALPVIDDLYLPRPRVEEITSLSTPTLYRYMKQGLFPRPHKLGPNRVGWTSSSVRAWMNSRTAA